MNKNRLSLLAIIFTTSLVAKPYQLFDSLDTNPKTKIRMSGKDCSSSADSLLSTQSSAVVKGSVQYQSKTIQLTADQMLFDSDAKTIIADNPNYVFSATRINGSAKKMSLLSNVHNNIEQATISTCPVTTDRSQDWQIDAKRINIDYINGWADIDDLYFLIKNVPVIYLPSLNFPVDKRRKSGLFYPDIGSSSVDGSNLKIPFYWNVTNNADYTGAINLIENRGFWSSHQLRFLSPKIYSQLHIENIDNDKIFNSKRNFISLKQRTTMSQNLSYEADINQTSDIDYFQDYKSELHKKDTEYLRKMVSLRYKQELWSMQIKWLEFQSLIKSNKTKYKLSPETKINFQPMDFIKISLTNSRFKTNDNDSKIQSSGERTVTELKLQRSFSSSYFTITPGLDLKNSHYNNLHNIENFDNTADNNAVTYFVDNRLFLEKSLNNSWSQTLEPRLFYAKRNKSDDNTPLFDSDDAPLSLNHNRLFTYDSYSGKDKFGELDRVSVGIGSKFIKNGQTILTLNLATAYDFIKEQQKDMMTKIGLNFGAWRFNSSLQIAQSNTEIVKSSNSINYEISPRRLLNLSHKTDKTDKKTSLDELQIGTRFAFSDQWQLVAKTKQNNSSLSQQTIGVAYSSCCWEVLASYQKQLKNSNQLNTKEIEYDNKFYLTFEFKGLSSSGIDQQIKNIIQ